MNIFFNLFKRHKRVIRKIKYGKHTQVRENASGRMWCYHSLRTEYDKKFYLPFMNMVRNEGYWTPYWLDIHPNNKIITNTQNTPKEIHDPKKYNLTEWNNEEGFNDPTIFEMKERSRPHLYKPGVPPPATPPQVFRMEPPKPDENDIKKINNLKKTMSPERFYTVYNKPRIRKMLK